MFHAGTMARLEPVLGRLVLGHLGNLVRSNMLAYKTMLVGDCFDWRKGRKAREMSTKLVKLTLISWWKAARSI